MRKGTLSSKMLRQCLFCLAYTLLGLDTTVRGTCFKDLLELYGASTSVLSYCIASTGLGIMLSSFISGDAQHKWPEYGCLQTSFSLLVLSFSVGLQAHAGNMLGLLFFSLAMGIGTGGTLTVIRNQCLILWRGTRFGPGPFMQSIFLSQGVGFILGAVAAKPFLSDELAQDDAKETSITTLFPIIGLVHVLLAILFLLIGLKDEVFHAEEEAQQLKEPNDVDTAIQNLEDKLSWPKAFLISVMVFCFFCNISLVISVSNYLIPTLQSGPLALSKHEGVTIQTIFFSAILMGRLFSTLALLRLSPNQNLMVILSVALAATTAILLFHSTSLIVLQILHGLFGLGIGSLGPSSLIWLEQFFVLRGRVVGLSALAGASGFLSSMVVLGTVVELVPNILFYYQALVILLCILLLSMGTWIGSREYSKKESGKVEDKEGFDNDAYQQEGHYKSMRRRTSIGQ